MAGYPSGVIQLFDVKSGNEWKSVETEKGYRGTSDYAFPSPNFKTVYVTQDKVIPARNGQPAVQLGQVEIWDLVKQTKADVIPTRTPQRGVVAGYLSPKADFLVTVERRRINPQKFDSDDTVIWDLKTKTPTWLSFGYSMAAFSPDGQTVALAVFGEDEVVGRLDLVRTSKHEVIWSKTPDSTLRGFSWPTFSSDGKFIAALDSEGRIDRPAQLKVINAATGKLLRKIDSPLGTTFMPPVFSADGTLIAVNTYDGQFLVWNHENNSRVIEKQYPKKSLCHKPAFSPDGARVAVSANDKVESDKDDTFPQPVIDVFDLKKPNDPLSIICPPGYCGPLVFSPNGRMLAHGSAGAVHLFDLTR